MQHADCGDLNRSLGETSVKPERRLARVDFLSGGGLDQGMVMVRRLANQTPSHHEVSGKMTQGPPTRHSHHTIKDRPPLEAQPRSGRQAGAREGGGLASSGSAFPAGIDIGYIISSSPTRCLVIIDTKGDYLGIWSISTWPTPADESGPDTSSLDRAVPQIRAEESSRPCPAEADRKLNQICS